MNIPKSSSSISEQVVSTIATDGDIVTNDLDNGDDNGASEGDNGPKFFKEEAKAAVRILSSSVILQASSSDGGTTVLDQWTKVMTSPSTSVPSNSSIETLAIISSSVEGVMVADDTCSTVSNTDLIDCRADTAPCDWDWSRYHSDAKRLRGGGNDSPDNTPPRDISFTAEDRAQANVEKFSIRTLYIRLIQTESTD